MCKTRVDELGAGVITVGPMRAFPLIKDLVTDVSWNYRCRQEIPPFTPQAGGAEAVRMQQIDVERMQEFRKCIECFLCQDVCHVLREHDAHGRLLRTAPDGAHRLAGDAPDGQLGPRASS